MNKRSRSSRRLATLHAIRLDYQPRSIAPILASLGPVVYAMRTRDGMLKIGYTADLSSRAPDLGSYGDLLAFRRGTRADERAIHRKLSGRAVRGREWYALSDPDAMVVVNEMRQDLGIGPMQTLTG